MSHQDAHCLSLWSLLDYSCIAVVPLSPRPRGVVFDAVAARFLVSNIDGSLYTLKKDFTSEILPMAGLVPNSPHFLRTKFNF